MKSVAFAFILLFAAVLSRADAIRNVDVYSGKSLSFCGKIECVSVSSSLKGGESSKICALQFTVKQPSGSVRLLFEVKKDETNEALLKSGRIVRAKGVCSEFSVSKPEGGSEDPLVQIVVGEASVEAFESGEPEGFVCEGAAKPTEEAETDAAERKTASRKAAPPSKEPSPRGGKPRASSNSSGFKEAEAMRSIVTVKGDKGSGSAFIAATKRGTFLVTNIHVVMGNDAKFVSVSNESVEVKPPSFASDRDIALYELKEPERFQALEIEDDVVELPGEEPVVVFGNSMGAGVNTRLKGNMKGVGPTVIEVSAKFVPGNSGSPVIDAKTGKVVGVSTYGTYGAKLGFITKGTRFEEVRRFGTRIDNLDFDALEPFETQKAANDVRSLGDVEALNKLAEAFFSDLYSGKDGKLNLFLSPSKYDFERHPGMERILKDWNSSMRSGGVDSIPRLLQRMKEQVCLPVEPLRKRKAFYAWTRLRLEEEFERNESYGKAIENLKKDIEEALKGRS